MSVRLQSACYRLPSVKDGGPSAMEMAVLIYLAYKANDEKGGLCCPSIATIVKATRYSRRSVIRAIESLCSKTVNGVPLLSKARKREDYFTHEYSSNRYYFHGLESLADCKVDHVENVQVKPKTVDRELVKPKRPVALDAVIAFAASKSIPEYFAREWWDLYDRNGWCSKEGVITYANWFPLFIAYVKNRKMQNGI